MKRNAAVTMLALLLASCQSSGATAIPGQSAPAQRHARASSSTPTGIVIPMYVYPGKLWDQVIAEHAAYPNVPIVLIAGITANGVGNHKIPAYATYIANEQAAGVKVIGYVATGYGKRSPSDIETQMTRWYSYYAVYGIFLDEMAPNDPSLYTAVTTYAHAHSLQLVMGNPGQNVPGNSGPDVINFYERGGYPSLSFLSQSAHTAYGKGRWSYIAGAVPYNAATITATVPYVAYLYATDGKEPECYCKLPSYFDQLVALLSGLDS